MFPLHQFIDAPRHVITQVIETKFIVGSVGDIGVIGFSALICVWFVFINTIDAQSMELKKRCIPLGVTFCKVIVHGYDVYALSSKCIEEDRKCRNQGFSFSCPHFRDFTTVQHHTTDELYVIMDHVPSYFRTCGQPWIFIGHLFAPDVHIFMCSC